MRNRATTPLKPVRLVKVRQSWSKYNLYNLSRFRVPPTVGRTHFQQKWTGKSLARSYHGEQVSESHWERMFSRRVRSVTPMDPYKLARDDGSRESAGRGAGLGENLGVSPSRGAYFKDSTTTPYTHMTFAPLERRLDVAIFRALFASSARQARQFVVHGAVKVNGKKMRYPGYLLNPGDMFQVDPERVMYATGAPKDSFDRRESRVAQKKAAEAQEAEGEEAAENNEQAEGENKEADSEPLDTKDMLKALLSQAKTILSTDKVALPAKRKQELRGFQKAVRRVMSRSANSAVLTDNLESQFAHILTVLKAKKVEAEKPKSSEDNKETKENKKESKESKESKEQSKEGSKEGSKDGAESKSAEDSKTESTSPAESKEAESKPAKQKPADALSEAFRKAAENPTEDVDTSHLSEEEYDVLKRALVQMRDNPIDSSKPYATPWRPRDYMSAFAFIPRYLEVNQNICAAVYVRHPVARPGVAEVPTPFSEQVATSAFHWYLRRR
ncbi:hypothetical protein BJY04DRAFT_214106 [Aspergillus karnatakaensis]|uniref:mitochondrial 37S ribosomal protein uS4m n=1 Tax=Aspergillus karnatakaensis TaxID=1810916 RepID=UPI003CCCD085